MSFVAGSESGAVFAQEVQSVRCFRATRHITAPSRPTRVALHPNAAFWSADCADLRRCSAFHLSRTGRKDTKPIAPAALSICANLRNLRTTIAVFGLNGNRAAVFKEDTDFGALFIGNRLCATTVLSLSCPENGLVCARRDAAQAAQRRRDLQSRLATRRFGILHAFRESCVQQARLKISPTLGASRSVRLERMPKVDYGSPENNAREPLAPRRRRLRAWIHPEGAVAELDDAG